MSTAIDAETIVKNQVQVDMIVTMLEAIRTDHLTHHHKVSVMLCLIH